MRTSGSGQRGAPSWVFLYTEQMFSKERLTENKIETIVYVCVCVCVCVCVAGWLLKSVIPATQEDCGSTSACAKQFTRLHLNRKSWALWHAYHYRRKYKYDEYHASSLPGHKLRDPISKTTNAKRTGGMAQVVECLPTHQGPWAQSQKVSLGVYLQTLSIPGEALSSALIESPICPGLIPCAHSRTSLYLNCQP
jgi:hypothetical protein